MQRLSLKQWGSQEERRYIFLLIINYDFFVQQTQHNNNNLYNKIALIMCQNFTLPGCPEEEGVWCNNNR